MATFSVTSAIVAWAHSLGYVAAVRRYKGAPAELVTVERLGGGVRSLVDHPTVAVQCWAEDEARAEDMAQEVWIVLWLKFDQLDLSASEARQRRWLEKLTETVILDLHRRQEPEPEPLTDELTDTLAIPGLDLSDTLFDLLALLPPDEQQLMQLRFEGYDAQEIADRLATTSGLTLSRDAIYQRISRIMKKLRQYKDL